jgi:WD40 repeat protein
MKWVFTNRVGIFQAIAFSPDENHVITDEGTIMRLWRIEGEALKLERNFNPKRNSVIGMAWSPDGRLVATGEESGPIRLWSMPFGDEAGVLKGHTRSVIALAFSPDGRTLASMCDDLTLRLWQVSTRRELLRFLSPIEDHSYFNLVFSPDGRALAARRVDDQGVRTWVWHAPSFDEIARRESMPEPIRREE